MLSAIDGFESLTRVMARDFRGTAVLECKGNFAGLFYSPRYRPGGEGRGAKELEVIEPSAPQ